MLLRSPFRLEQNKKMIEMEHFDRLGRCDLKTGLERPHGVCCRIVTQAPGKRHIGGAGFIWRATEDTVIAAAGKQVPSMEGKSGMVLRGFRPPAQQPEPGDYRRALWLFKPESDGSWERQPSGGEARARGCPLQTACRRLKHGAPLAHRISPSTGAPAFRRRNEGQRLPLANRMPPAEARRSPCAPHLARISTAIQLAQRILSP